MAGVNFELVDQKELKADLVFADSRPLFLLCTAPRLQGIVRVWLVGVANVRLMGLCLGFFRYSASFNVRHQDSV